MLVEPLGLMHHEHPYPHVDGQARAGVADDQPAADIHAGAVLGVSAVVPQADLDVRPERQPAGDGVVREPSSPVRNRVTAASAAASRLVGLSTPSFDVPTHSVSALKARPKPPAPLAPSSPRIPATAIAIDNRASRAGPPLGASSIPPAP